MLKFCCIVGWQENLGHFWTFPPEMDIRLRTSTTIKNSFFFRKILQYKIINKKSNFFLMDKHKDK